jgi:hypothetical protein
MPARTRPEGELLVIFSRNGERDDARLVPNGERACQTAIMILAGRGVLHAGDQLTVTRYDTAEGDVQ